MARSQLILLAATALGAIAVASPARASPPSYITAEQMQASFQENGIQQSGRRQTVLQALCEGVGYAHGSFPYQRYHIFQCYITTARAQDKLYRVNVTQSRYSYIAIP
jgi:hypothetical protein